MRVTLGSRTFLIRWQYDVKDIQFAEAKADKPKQISIENMPLEAYATKATKPRKVTCCTIDSIAEDRTVFPVTMGCSILNPVDQFSKSKGRKKSLARAMEAAEFSFSERKIIWEAYFKFCSTEEVVLV